MTFRPVLTLNIDERKLGTGSLFSTLEGDWLKLCSVMTVTKNNTHVITMAHAIWSAWSNWITCHFKHGIADFQSYVSCIDKRSRLSELHGLLQTTQFRSWGGGFPDLDLRCHSSVLPLHRGHSCLHWSCTGSIRLAWDPGWEAGRRSLTRNHSSRKHGMSTG